MRIEVTGILYEGNVDKRVYDGEYDAVVENGDVYVHGFLGNLIKLQKGEYEIMSKSTQDKSIREQGKSMREIVNLIDNGGKPEYDELYWLSIALRHLWLTAKIDLISQSSNGLECIEAIAKMAAIVELRPETYVERFDLNPNNVEYQKQKEEIQKSVGEMFGGGK